LYKNEGLRSSATMGAMPSIPIPNDSNMLVPEDANTKLNNDEHLVAAKSRQT
jgi:hypothetical protein